MPLPITVVDAFASEPFGGNPAAVCVLAEPADPEWMQRVAAEMNLSETAFLLAQAGGAWHLRWFTPSVEVDLCGHATLASAHVLWESGRLRHDQPAELDTKSGRLVCRLDGGWIRMDFPAKPVSAAPVPAGLKEALGATTIWFGRNGMDLFAELATEAEVRALAPDVAALGRIPARGCIVTARGAREDFVSRFFAPGSGIAEDPVTGSAHCALGPYWSEKLGRDRLTGYQASRRGGVVEVAVRGDRVELGGHAVTVLEGSLRC